MTWSTRSNTVTEDHLLPYVFLPPDLQPKSLRSNGFLPFLGYILRCVLRTIAIIRPWPSTINILLWDRGPFIRVFQGRSLYLSTFNCSFGRKKQQGNPIDFSVFWEDNGTDASRKVSQTYLMTHFVHTIQKLNVSKMYTQKNMLSLHEGYQANLFRLCPLTLGFVFLENCASSKMSTLPNWSWTLKLWLVTRRLPVWPWEDLSTSLCPNPPSSATISK